MLKRFIRPAIELVHRAVLQFLKYWRGAQLGKQIALLPLVLLALLWFGFYTFFFGCGRQ